ncbi:Peptidyl-prolyl cis-trans isomerase CYP23 [Vitis vinifera]|uniref:Peptidyl-prolyl cis-trans isomerase CYP23 n=1 Tax=Vitis vinifera TaxID=29760 RepID=A0A438D720_VITVI|nr:Peptidyl-prolyl cis-trans isomerase CYP23 [Vitis vinifera]
MESSVYLEKTLEVELQEWELKEITLTSFYLLTVETMAGYADPDSASSSFSMLLGDAPHLDGQYAIFGRVTKGDETLKKLEQLPTRREGSL